MTPINPAAAPAESRGPRQPQSSEAGAEPQAGPQSASRPGADIVWLAADLPDSIHHGGTLRLVNLARELSRTANCYLVVLNESITPLEMLQGTGAFAEILTLQAPTTKENILGHLRLTNVHYLRRRHPAYFRQTLATLRRWISARAIRVGIAVGLDTIEFLEELPLAARFVDDYDCVTLSIERRLHNTEQRPGLANRLADYLHYLRTRQLEASLTARFDRVTTISPVDQARLRQLSATRPEAIEIVQNGVDEQILRYSGARDTETNAVVFWGNLAFRPNRDAVLYFHRTVYAPYLEPQGVRWHIVGGNADATVRALGAGSRHIEVVGFVPDLANYVSRFPVMVNPLISGSGLKNKVLEAFALRIAVVSTSMGTEALEASDGVHYLQANAPAEFAAHVLACLQSRDLRRRLTEAARELVNSRYRWETIGQRLGELLAASQSVDGEPR